MSDRLEVPSPCVKVCRIDDASGLCRGCLRTLDEIARWTVMTPAERLAVLHRLGQRRRAHPPEPSPLDGGMRD